MFFFLLLFEHIKIINTSSEIKNLLFENIKQETHKISVALLKILCRTHCCSQKTHHNPTTLSKQSNNIFKKGLQKENYEVA